MPDLSGTKSVKMPAGLVQGGDLVKLSFNKGPFIIYSLWESRKFDLEKGRSFFDKRFFFFGGGVNRTVNSKDKRQIC